MKAPSVPINYLWWLVSRSSAIVALILISLSVLIGLAMSTKVIGRPGLKRNLARLHEHVALTALIAIGTHGLSLLGDHWLRPGWSGITIPFAMSYRPQFTGAGIIGGYIAALLGPSFYLRRRIGTRRWRRLHTFVVLAWVMSVAHTLGAGSDAHKAWLQALVVAPSIPIVYLLVMRILRYDAREPRRGASQRGSPSHLTHGATAQPPGGGGAPDRRAERHRPGALGLHQSPRLRAVSKDRGRAALG